MHADVDASSSKPATTLEPTIELTVRWGASVLAVAHLSPPRSFHAGEGGAEAACDVVLPAAILGASRVPLVLVDGDRCSLLILPAMTGTVALGDQPAAPVAELEASELARPFAALPGASMLTLPLGSKADLEIAGVTIHVAFSLAHPATVARATPDARNLAFVCASAFAQIGLLGVLSFVAPPPAHIDGPSAEQIYAMRAALEEVEEKQQEMRAAEAGDESEARARADSKEGGTGTRARGEEGSMGAPNARASGQRFGIAGPSINDDPHIARAAALREAAEFGMVGLLDSGAGGDPDASGGAQGADAFLFGGAPGGGGSASRGAIGAIGHGVGARGSAPGIGAGAGRLGGRHQARSSAPARGNGAFVGAGAAPIATAPLPAALPPPASIPAAQPIDPNGRFATTYRPGGGHLAAFESAVARGIVPIAAREMIGDLGARTTPPVVVPPHRALGLRADLERTELAPGGGPFHLRLSLRSSADHAPSRPHLSVHLVLDVSGSMKGESLDRARSAAEALVDKLAPTDDFSLTTFSTDANVLVPDGPVGPRRGYLHQVIRTIEEEGGTNIGAGLELGYAQASAKGIPDDAVRVVLLVSDGHANAGITRGDSLSRLALDAFQRGIQTSSFGLGADYDGALMSAIAAEGAGGYYYLRDAEQIAPALGTELDRRLDPVATAVEVRVRLDRDVDLLHVYGSRRLDEAEAARVRRAEIAADQQAEARDHIKQDRREDSEGGMRFFLPAFARDDAHALLVKLQVPAGLGARSIAGIELKYKDRLTRKNVVEEIPVKAAYADSDARSAATLDASVARTVQAFAAGETLANASALIARGDRSGAASLLAERELVLRAAADTLHEPLLLHDADRLARLRGHTGARDGMGDPLVLAMLLETAGRTHLR